MSKVDLELMKKELEDARKLDAERAKRASYYNLKDGLNLVRFLPPWEGAKSIFSEAKYHFNVVKKRSILCPTTYGLPCPVCEAVEQLYATKNKDDKTQANLIKAKAQWKANVLDLDDKKNQDKARVYTFGPTVRKELLKYFADPEYGDFTDPQNGLNVKITKTGEGLDTDYDVKMSRANSAVENWQKVAGSMRNLDELIKEELLDYAKIKGVLEGTDKLPDRKEEDEKTVEVKTEQKPDSEKSPFVNPKTEVKTENAVEDPKKKEMSDSLARLRAMNQKS